MADGSHADVIFWGRSNFAVFEHSVNKLDEGNQSVFQSESLIFSALEANIGCQ